MSDLDLTERLKTYGLNKVLSYMIMKAAHPGCRWMALAKMFLPPVTTW